MREEEEEEEGGRWCARWEEELPRPDELMPLSQSLITPDLALAFDIPTTGFNPSDPGPPPSAHTHHQPPPPVAQPDFDAGDMGGAGGGAGSGGDEPARTLKRPRLVWTPQLHKRFVDAVGSLGIKNAVPKTIMQLMSVDGLTRENVASHLQKYRLYLRRMQGLNSSSGGSGGGGPISAADAATDQLFASAPVPHHFLTRGHAGAESFMPYVPLGALQHHQHMAAAAAVAAQQQYYHQRHTGHFGSPPAGGGGFDHGFLSRAQPQPGMHRIVGPAGFGMVQRPAPPTADSYVEDLESGAGEGGGGGRRVLTLFPTGED